MSESAGQEERDEPVSPELKAQAEALLAEGLTIKRLDAETIISLDRVFRPSREEVGGMIQDLCVRKGWTRGYFAALLSIGQHDLQMLETGKKRAVGHLAKLIWLIHALEFAPATATSVIHVATWGRVSPKPPRQRRVKFTKEQRLAVIEELRALSKIKVRPEKKLSVQDLCEKHGFTKDMALYYAKLAGYKLKNMKLKSYRNKERTPLYLRADSIYMNVDWRGDLRDIARKAGVSTLAVTRVFYKMKKIPRTEFIRHVLACGKDRRHFTPIIWRRRIKGFSVTRRQKKIQNNTCAEIIPSGKVARNDEEISATTKNLGTQTQREGVEDSNQVQLQRDEREREISSAPEAEENPHR